MIGSIQIYKLIQLYLCTVNLLAIPLYYKDTINNAHLHVQHRSLILCIIRRIASEPKMRIRDILLFAIIPKFDGLFTQNWLEAYALLCSII